MLTQENIVNAAEAASTDRLTIVAKEVGTTAKSYGPSQVAVFHLVRRRGDEFNQALTSFDLGGTDLRKIQDIMYPFTRDVEYDVVQMDPHIVLRINEANQELDEAFVTKVLNAVARSLA